MSQMRTNLKIKNKSRAPNLVYFQNQNGQAFIEYMLFLVLSVTFVLGLSYQFYQPFQAFVQNGMGLYTQCLLETGEVPRLGGPSAIQEDKATCGLNMGDGTKPPAQGGTPYNPGSLGNNNSGNRNSSGNGNDRGSGGGSSIRGPTNMSSSSSGSRTGDAAGASGKTTQVPLPPGQSSETFRASGRSVWAPSSSSRSSARVIEVSIDKMSEADKKALKSNANKKNNTVAADETQTRKPKTIKVSPPERKVANIGDEEGFSFGDYLRYLIIIIILLVLIIVIGGQAYRLGKSWEK